MDHATFADVLDLAVAEPVDLQARTDASQPEERNLSAEQAPDLTVPELPGSLDPVVVHSAHDDPHLIRLEARPRRRRPMPLLEDAREWNGRLDHALEAIHYEGVGMRN